MIVKMYRPSSLPSQFADGRDQPLDCCFVSKGGGHFGLRAGDVLFLDDHLFDYPLSVVVLVSISLLIFVSSIILLLGSMMVLALMPQRIIIQLIILPLGMVVLTLMPMLVVVLRC
jgi:hypothetical protein